MSKAKKYTLTVFFILSIFLLFIYLRSTKKDLIQTEKTQQIGVSYNNITPNKNTEDDIVSEFGIPVNERLEGENKILEYKSNNPNFNNEFTIITNKVNFIKQMVTSEDKITISDLNQKYGNYSSILYGPGSVSNFNLYIYLDKGIAYIGNQQANIVTQIWYFPPTNINNFINLYAKNYSVSYKPRQ